MGKLVQIIVSLLTLTLTSSFVMPSIDKLYINYLFAINNNSTFQYFLVVKVKNQNTGLTREYCTNASFLKGALHKEYHLGYDWMGSAAVYAIAIANKDRYFKLKNEDAIRNLDAGYSMNELHKFEKKINFDSLACQIRKSDNWNSGLILDKPMSMTAHVLFNRGILTGENNCYGGRLFYVKIKNVKD